MGLLDKEWKLLLRGNKKGSPKARKFSLELPFSFINLAISAECFCPNKYRLTHDVFETHHDVCGSGN